MEPPTGVPRTEELLEQADWLCGLARALCRDEQGAADLQQETWLAALGSGERARDARAWLASVARRLAAGAHRRDMRRAAREERRAREGPGEAPDVSDSLAAAELSARLARAVADLDEPYRTALVLRYYEDLAPRRIAGRLGLDVRAVESRLRRGRERLREKLDERCGGREVWLGAALALAGGEPASRGLVVAAAAALLIAGGAAGLAALRPRSQRETAAADVELRGPVVPVPLAAEEPRMQRAPVPEGTTRTSVVISPVPAVTETSLLLVVEGDETPLADAEVSWRADGEEREAKSDTLGRVSLRESGDATELAVSVAATPRTRRLATRVPVATVTRLVLARRGGRLGGTVLDLSGHPVPSAEVLAWTRRGRVDPGNPGRTTVTDEMGRFALEDLADAEGGVENWALSARAPGLCTFESLEGRIDPRGEVAEVTLVVEPAWDVQGRVIDPAGGAIAEVQLVAYHAGRPRETREGRTGWRRGSAEFGVRTDEDGSFAFLVVAPTPEFERPWRLQASSIGHRNVWQELEGPGWLDVVLEWGGELDGVVVDAAGEPVERATVQLRAKEHRATRTDAAGRFVFEGLTALEGALLVVTAPGHALAVHPVDLAGQRSVARVVLEPACRLEGVALDAEGRPLGSAKVHFRGDRLVGSPWLPRSRGWTWETLCLSQDLRTDPRGRFSVEGLYPGTYEVELRPERREGELLAFARVVLDPRGGDEPLELREGEGLEQTLTVRGCVVPPRGARLELFTVRGSHFLEGEGEPDWTPVIRAFRGPDGSFEIRGLRPGRWSFGAISAEGGERLATPMTSPEFYGPGTYELGELRLLGPPR